MRGVLVLLEDVDGPAAFQPPWPKVPKCRCENGPRIFRGSPSCSRCGKHVRGLFNPFVTYEDYGDAQWDRLMRQRAA